MSADLPRPLIQAVPPTDAPDPEAVPLLDLLARVHHAVLEGRATGALLEELRFEAYRQASTTWDDPWRTCRVADVEELFAEVALQRGDLQGAWHAWRGAWWIRRLLDGRGPASPLALHSDRVMAQLKIATGRGR